MRHWRVASAILALASSVGAQDAASNALLKRIKAHMHEEFSRVPNYTCLETTDRFYRFLGRQQKIRRVDTVRLEIVFSGHQEWYAAPGDPTFSETSPGQFIHWGMIGTGAFAGLLNNILLPTGTTFFYRGEQKNEGRRAVRYDYSSPQALGRFKIRTSYGTGNVGEQGSFWADAQSLDLVRISSHAVEIPEYLRVQARRIDVSYARTHILYSPVLLAQEGDMYLLENTGEEDINHVEFTHCRAFSAQSAIRFDSDDRAAQPTKQDWLQGADGMRPMATLRENLPITLRLTAPITEKDAVGALVSAQVVGDVAGNNIVLVRGGSMVRGRIRHIEPHNTGFWVSLEFTEIDVEGPPFRFYADLRSIQGVSGVQPTLTREFLLETGLESGSKEKITVPELPGVASFFIRGGRLSIPSSLRMTWTTRSLTR